MEKSNGKENIRKETIRRYLSGKSPKSIYTSLKKSKRWFFKWLERYRKGNSNWFKDQPKTPYLIANKVDKEIETFVISTRKKLKATKYAQVGAGTIQQGEIKKLNTEPPPIWTINRILKRNGLVSKKKPYEPKGKSYPEIAAFLEINTLHQVDLI